MSHSPQHRVVIIQSGEKRSPGVVGGILSLIMLGAAIGIGFLLGSILLVVALVAVGLIAIAAVVYRLYRAVVPGAGKNTARFQHAYARSGFQRQHPYQQRTCTTSHHQGRVIDADAEVIHQSNR